MCIENRFSVRVEMIRIHLRKGFNEDNHRRQPIHDPKQPQSSLKVTKNYKHAQQSDRGINSSSCENKSIRDFHTSGLETIQFEN
jgi:hypothetical protein